MREMHKMRKWRRLIKSLNIYQIKYPGSKWRNPNLTHMLEIKISVGETSIQIPIFNRGKLRMRIKKFRFHFKTENFIQGDKLQEYDELDEEINNLSDDDREPQLTQQD
jgi:hypothetical protein